MKSQSLKILNTNSKTAYNPTIPFKDKGVSYIGVRVESFDSELDSRTHFAYKLTDNSWRIDDSSPSFPFQDPTTIKLKDELCIAGIRVQDKGNSLTWNQEFYKGDSIRNLEYFASGPIGMKDIRLVELEDRIGVFTRPQGRVGGLGRIGYFEIGVIEELTRLTETDWYSAPLIDHLFEETTWGGVNQAIVLSDGEIGVIGHKAHQQIFEDASPIKHYRAISFRFNPKNNKISSFKTIATRADFPSSPSKRTPELSDIIFPAGIDEKYNLYCGLSDYCIGVKKIMNPF